MNRCICAVFCLCIVSSASVLCILYCIASCLVNYINNIVYQTVNVGRKVHTNSNWNKSFLWANCRATTKPNMINLRCCYFRGMSLRVCHILRFRQTHWDSVLRLHNTEPINTMHWIHSRVIQYTHRQRPFNNQSINTDTHLFPKPIAESTVFMKPGEILNCDSILIYICSFRRQ